MGATTKPHPHLARLDAHSLDVRYRASAEPQLLTIRIQGNPKYTWEPDYHLRVSMLLELAQAGLGGGARFAPETVRAARVSGPLRGDDPGAGPTFAWQLKVSSIDGSYLLPMLNLLADGWNVGETNMLGDRFEPDPQFYPSHVSIVGELPLDEGATCVTTASVLAALATPELAFAAYPEVPFAMRTKAGRARGARLKVQTAATSRMAVDELSMRLGWLAKFLSVHPGVGFPLSFPEVAATKSALTVTWEALDVPVDLARGPLVNVLRRFHHEIAPVAGAELHVAGNAAL